MSVICIAIMLLTMATTLPAEASGFKIGLTKELHRSGPPKCHRCLLPVFKGDKHGYASCDGRMSIPYRYDHASAFIDGYAVATTCLADSGSCESALVEILDTKGGTVTKFTFGGDHLKVHDAGKDWFHLNAYDGYSLIAIGTDKTPEAFLFRDYGGFEALPQLQRLRDSAMVMIINGYDDASRAVCAFRSLTAEAKTDTAGSAFHEAYLRCPESPAQTVAAIHPIPSKLRQSHQHVVRIGKNRFLAGDKGAFHIINTKGRRTKHEHYGSVVRSLRWSSNYLTVIEKDGKVGLLDGKGRLVMPCVYGSIDKFHDNDLAYSVRRDEVTGKTLHGWVTERGRYMPAQFDRVRNAGAGLVCAERNGRAAYFTCNGKQVTPFAYRFFYDTDRVRCSRAVYAEVYADTADLAIPVYITNRGKTIWKGTIPQE